MSEMPTSHKDKRETPGYESVLKRLFRTGGGEARETEEVVIHEGVISTKRIRPKVATKESYFNRLTAKRNTQGLLLAADPNSPTLGTLTPRPKDAALATRQTADQLDKITDRSTETSVPRSRTEIDDQSAILLARKITKYHSPGFNSAHKTSEVVVAEAVISNYESKKAIDERSPDAKVLLNMYDNSAAPSPASQQTNAEKESTGEAAGGAGATVRKSSRIPVPKRQSPPPEPPKPTLALEISGTVTCIVTYPHTTTVKKMRLVNAIPTHKDEIKKLLQENPDALVPATDLSRQLRVRRPPTQQ